jgi:hypothetical protein
MRIHRYLKGWIAALLAAGVLAITLAGSSPAHAQSCPPAVPLERGQYGYVLPGPANALRDLPGLNRSGSTVIGSLEGSTVFLVLDNPICRDGYNWWYVSTVEPYPRAGWTADGDFSRQWIAPAGAGATCYNAPLSRLTAGMMGRVLPGLPNALREYPASGRRLGVIPGGEVFNILSGPECGPAGRRWWQVSYRGSVGWTAEGEGSVYWLEPYYGVPVTPTPGPINPACPLVPRLQVGTTGMITPGDPNVLRDLPGLNHSGSTVIGRLTEGALFSVLNGPVCRDGYHWWQVTAAGQTGWTAEGENGVYWADPLVCANGLVSRIAPGMQARITPGLPNRLRSAPSVDTGTIIGRIAAGRTVRVLAAFQCDPQGRLWWQVAYGSQVGWMVEGENGVYWLEPA